MKAKIIKAQVEQIRPLTDTIMQLILRPEEYIAYQAGQYLQVFLDKEALSFSIANAPLGSHQYELHIRHSLENPYSQRLFAHIKKYGSLNLSLPFGECSFNHLHPQRPILFIARGTGFAPIKAMIEQLLSNADPRTFELFWEARMENDLYMDEQVTQWQRHVNSFTYFSARFDEDPTPLISLVLARHASDLMDWQVVLGGPFDMAYNTRDILVQQGMSSEYLFSDAFSFEEK